MKMIRTWDLLLVVGVLLGGLAVWASGAPVLTTGSSILGGHEYRWYVVNSAGGPFIGCTSPQLCGNFCYGAQWADCSAAYENERLHCYGGSVLITNYSLHGGRAWPTGDAMCGGDGRCSEIKHAWCDYVDP